MMNALTRARHLVIALAATAVVLAGCGGEESPGGGEGSSSETGEPSGDTHAVIEAEAGGERVNLGRVMCGRRSSTTGASYAFMAAPGSSGGWSMGVVYDEIGGPSEDVEDAEFDFANPSNAHLEYSGSSDDVAAIRRSMSPGEDGSRTTGVEGSHVMGTITMGEGDTETEVEFEINC